MQQRQKQNNYLIALGLTPRLLNKIAKRPAALEAVGRYSMSSILLTPVYPTLL